MTSIFLSYRRKDNPDAAGRIYDRLRDRFGEEAVFFDIDDVPFGVDFREHVDRSVARCDVLLVIIGDSWLELDAQGRSRLEDPGDTVRVEIESALERDIPVIPVLVGEARAPREDDLPPPLKSLSYRNAAEVRSGASFSAHIERLLDALEAALVETTRHVVGRRGAGRHVWVRASLLAAAVAVVSSALLFKGWSVAPGRDDDIQQATPVSVTVDPDRNDVDSPWPIDLDETSHVTLGRSDDYYFALSAPAGRFHVTVDLRTVDGLNTNLQDQVILVDENGSALDTLLRFNEIDVGTRGTAEFRLERPTDVRLRVVSRRNTTDFWVTVRQLPAPGLLRLFGEIAPERLRLEEPRSNPLATNETHYFRVDLEPGRYLVRLDFEHEPGVRSNIFGILRLMDGDGGAPRQIIRFNEVDRSTRGTAEFSLRDAGRRVLSVQNTGGPTITYHLLLTADE